MTMPRQNLDITTPGSLPRQKVWRVYNGWTGNGAVHRIVIAETKEDAENFAWRVWGVPGRSEPVSRENLYATEVLFFEGVETEDAD